MTDGAEMQQVDHPGSPGAESVAVRGQPDASGNAAVADDGEADGWGRGDAAAAPAMPQVAALSIDLPLLRRLSPPSMRRLQRHRARRSPAPRGRSIGATPATGRPRDVAWAATLRAVAHTQRSRARRRGLSFAVEPDELLVPKRVSAPDHLLMLVVDASGSMAGRLTAVARALAVRALQRAYVERQQVAMIAFRARGAELLFGPTTSVDRARRALDHLPLGGATPLGRGLDLAHRTLRRAAIQGGCARATVLLISDGDANVGDRHGYGSAHLDVEQACRKLTAVPGVEFILLDTTEPGKDPRPARWVAETLRARHVRLDPDDQGY